MSTPGHEVDLLISEGNLAYQSGLHAQATGIYRRAAEQARAGHDMRQYVLCTRWLGNALLWAHQPDEACPHLLEAVSYGDHPEADPADVYAAITDLCLLAVWHRPYTFFQRMLAEARDFLARRHLEPWSHRLDRLQALGHLRRGEFAAAHAVACRAWQGAENCIHGPRYQHGAYLDIMFRAAWGMGDVRAMDAALELFRGHGEKSIVISQVRGDLCRALRCFFGEGRDVNREAIECLLREILGVMNATEWLHDEGVDALRLWAALGRHEEARAMLDKNAACADADTALLRLDLALCELGSQRGWRLPVGTLNDSSDVSVLPAPAEHEAEAAPLSRLVQAAEAQAAQEDARMECTQHQQRVTQRKRWLASESFSGTRQGGRGDKGSAAVTDGGPARAA